MLLLMTVTCVVLMLVILGIIVRDLFARTCDVLSWRNLFLVGYLHFVCLSGYFTVSAGMGAIRRDAITEHSAMLYAASAVLYFVTFMFAARWARGKMWLTRAFPRVELPVTAPGLIASTAALLALGSFVAFALPQGLLGLIGHNIRGGLATTAVCLATYYLLASRFNPLSWTIFAITFAVGGVICVTGGIGRRDLAGMLIGVPWVWYFASLRYRSARSIIMFVGVLSVAGVLAMALYTGIRFRGVGDGRQPTASQRVEHLTALFNNPKIASSAVENLLYTDTAGNAMYIMDNYPANYEFTPAKTIYWILINPIPRTVWADKPDSLGLVLSRQMGTDANLGPGVTGQAYSEGGLLAVFAYALLFGVIAGAADRALMERASNPYFVAIMVSSAGNILGLPRGDVGLFSMQVLGAAISSAFFLSIVRVLTYGWANAFPKLYVTPPQTDGETVAWSAGESDEEYPQLIPYAEEVQRAGGYDG